MIEAGTIVYLPYLPTLSGSEPNGPRALRVFGKVSEIRGGNLAFIRWTSGPDLARCGVGGGWYATEELREKDAWYCCGVTIKVIGLDVVCQGACGRSSR